MTGVVLTLFLCGPGGCQEVRREFPQFQSCAFVEQVAEAAVRQAGPGSWSRCEVLS